MRQVLQDMRSGATEVVVAPTPEAVSNTVLIKTTSSLISAGTERMLVEFGQGSYLDKARQQPDKVKMVLEKAATDGVLTTLDAVKSKLSQPLPLGYCNVGVVAAIGKGVSGFQVGDRVVSNGPHSDVVRVSTNLAARIPDGVTDEEAAFAVVASIGLQGLRLAQPSLGEAFVVTGVGLIGLLTVQLLRANGCRVLAIDYDDAKLELARQFGADICNPNHGEDPVAAGLAFSRGVGVDGVIITASTKSNDPVTHAARMSRKRGRIILVGVTGLELNRADFYEKELTFQVSCSYGPGRYDSNYEEKAQDYPVGFVRWTEKRNFEAVLDMMAARKIDVRPLISHRVMFDNAPRAYEILTNDSSALGILLVYDEQSEGRFVSTVVLNETAQFSSEKAVLGFIGAGNYASRVLIPAFKSAGAQLFSISTSGGINGVIFGRKAGFAQATTDTDGVISSQTINTIAIVTRHDSHAPLAVSALRAGKHVFVEKPLAINLDQLEDVKEVYAESRRLNGLHLMVGFNRRFSPQVRKVKSLLDQINEPKSFIFTVNAGSIPADHWTQDIGVGGGRIIGEACHFIDLMRFLAGHKIVSVQARRMGNNQSAQVPEDKAIITLGFADGSVGTICYLANGSSKFPKERIEVFVAGRVLQLDNFRKLKGFGWPGFRSMNLWRQDKGQQACVSAFLKAIENGEATPIDADELFEVSRVSIQVAEMLRSQAE